MCYPNQLLSSNVQHIINFNVSILKKKYKNNTSLEHCRVKILVIFFLKEYKEKTRIFF
jgi:hypothetical protein